MVEGKAALLAQLQRDWKRYWDLQTLKELGFTRRQCSSCKKWFWATTEQSVCNDSSCRPYEFIDNQLMPKKWDYFTAWKAIQKFFVKEDHTPLERYPVLARWFPNLYFTIAGVVDFYRMDNSRFVFEFPPGVNKAILLQPSMRFNDIPQVGISGRHWTTHAHIEQASLYDPVKKTGYWKEKCIELDYRLLTEVFGIKPDRINWLEDAWLGAGAFGYSLEYHLAGIEMGNAVFTEFEGTPDNWRVMPQKVIDMGAGLERFVWASQRTPTSYDAVLGPVITKMVEKGGVNYDKQFFARYAKLAGYLNLDEVPDIEKAKEEIAAKLGVTKQEMAAKVEPMQAVYAVADHAKTLLFAAADGGIPSNVGGGYNLRVILRRALSFIDKYNLNFDLVWTAEKLAKFYKPLNPELAEGFEQFKDVMTVEEKRYRGSLERVKKAIEVILEKKEPLDEERLVELYDSQGITPELLAEVAAQKKVKLDLPSDIYTKVTARHEKERPEKHRLAIDVQGLEPTRALYYEKEKQYEFSAKVLKVADNKFVILDQTAFYPRGGGQEPDHGTLDGCKVYDAEKVDNIIVHAVEEPKFKEGDTIKCRVDEKRRLQITIHHDATHMINGAARRVLGPWVWQAGSKKDVDKAHLDVTHYDSLTPEQVEKIESLANKTAAKGLKITKEVLQRPDAEKKYGFTIYQGAAVPSRELRIVRVGDFEVEACGGTHGWNTKDLLPIIITKVERPADGTVRFIYKAGPAAESYLKESEAILKKSAKLLDTKEQSVPKAAAKLLEEWKAANKQLQELQARAAAVKREGLAFTNKDGMRWLVESIPGAGPEQLREISRKMSAEDTIILLIGTADRAYVFGAAGTKAVASGVNVGQLAGKLATDVGGRGGGTPGLAQGSGPAKEKAAHAVDKLRRELGL